MVYAQSCGPSIDPCMGTIPPQCGSIPARHTEQQQRIQQLVIALGAFIGECDLVLNQLNSARNTEMMDATTSNYSFFGSIITNMSYRENMNVANRVDALRNQALNINHMLASINQPAPGTRGPLPFVLLDTNFNGHQIRQAESNEHSFFWNFFTDNAYSSMASTNTMQTIQWTMDRINAVRYQAASVQNMLSCF